MGVGKGRPGRGRQFAINDLRNKTLRDLEQVRIGGSLARRVHGGELTTGLAAWEAARQANYGQGERESACLTDAVDETGLSEEAFPTQCPFTVEQVLDAEYWEE